MNEILVQDFVFDYYRQLIFDFPVNTDICSEAQVMKLI